MVNSNSWMLIWVIKSGFRVLSVDPFFRPCHLEFSAEQCSRPLLVDDYYRNFTNQYIGDCNNPIEESLYTNQYTWVVEPAKIRRFIDSKPQKDSEHNNLPICKWESVFQICCVLLQWEDRDVILGCDLELCLRICDRRCRRCSLYLQAPKIPQ